MKIIFLKDTQEKTVFDIYLNRRIKLKAFKKGEQAFITDDYAKQLIKKYLAEEML